MKRLTALLLILVTTALYSEPEIRQDLDHVGLSIVLPPSWQMQMEETVRIPGTPKEYGFSHLISSDLSRPSFYLYDEVLVERFDNLDAAERTRFIDGEYRTGALEDVRLEETGPLPVEVADFEDASVYRYRKSRGSEAHQQSTGYVLFAVDGSSAWRIKVGGLDRAFRLDPARYRRIVESIRIEQPEAGRVSRVIPRAAGG